jgi:hypothetical protein
VGNAHPSNKERWFAMDQHKTMSGSMVCRLMRKHRVTISDLASKHQITQKRVREVRAKGVSGFLACECVFLITGQWPDQRSTTV